MLGKIIVALTSAAAGAAICYGLEHKDEIKEKFTSDGTITSPCDPCDCCDDEWDCECCSCDNHTSEVTEEPSTETTETPASPESTDTTVSE